MNTVEFAIRDGVPYAIDFMNSAPDLDKGSLTPEQFEWAVATMTEFLIGKASTPALTAYLCAGIVSSPNEVNRTLNLEAGEVRRRYHDLLRQAGPEAIHDHIQHRAQDFGVTYGNRVVCQVIEPLFLRRSVYEKLLERPRPSSQLCTKSQTKSVMTPHSSTSSATTNVSKRFLKSIPATSLMMSWPVSTPLSTRTVSPSSSSTTAKAQAASLTAIA